MKKYLVRTESGSVYTLTESKHVFSDDYWIAEKEGQQEIVFCFAHPRKTSAGVVAAFLAENTGIPMDKQNYIRVMDKTISEQLRSKECVGQAMYFISEHNLKNGLEHLKLLIKWNLENNHAEMVKWFHKYGNALGHTSKIIDVSEI